VQEPKLSTVDMPVKAAIVPTPPRMKRVLWDQFHSIKYPPAYLPRDNLDVRNDILDWHGDHLLTNYHTLYTFLRENGMYVEILSSPFTCFNATDYGVMIIADSEEEFYAEEVAKLTEVCSHCPPRCINEVGPRLHENSARSAS
jgi:membrane-bound transcription factor site-1 protease